MRNFYVSSTKPYPTSHRHRAVPSSRVNTFNSRPTVLRTFFASVIVQDPLRYNTRVGSSPWGKPHHLKRVRRISFAKGQTTRRGAENRGEENHHPASPTSGYPREFHPRASAEFLDLPPSLFSIPHPGFQSLPNDSPTAIEPAIQTVIPAAKKDLQPILLSQPRIAIGCGFCTTPQSSPCFSAWRR